MQGFQDIDCYISGLNYYYDKIVSTSGVCDAVEFDLLSDFKVKLDEFNTDQTRESFNWLYNAYESFYVDGFLHRSFVHYDLQEQFDCLSELMMRLKRICSRA